MNLNYNEPDAMKKYLVTLWVKKEDIYPDYAWFDTYDSMFRVGEIFSVKKIVVFTQEYHLYRALYISNKLWIESVWIISDRHKYLWIVRYKAREVLSRIKAFIEIEILKSEVKYKKDIKIEIK
jgi:vancomycin permeability regulator SanA